MFPGEKHQVTQGVLMHGKFLFTIFCLLVSFLSTYQCLGPGGPRHRSRFEGFWGVANESTRTWEGLVFGQRDTERDEATDVICNPNLDIPESTCLRPTSLI